jgi:hypothetical protein
MVNISLKLAVVSSFSALSAIATISMPTQAATVVWDLKFFDELTGDSIGTGEFSYDDSEPFEGTFPNPIPNQPEFPDITIRKSDNWYALESFSATIENATWNWNLSDGFFTVNIGSQEQRGFSYAALFAWQPPQTDTFPGSGGGTRSVDAYVRYIPGFFKTENWSFGDFLFDLFLGLRGTSSFTLDTPEYEPPLEGTWTATKRVNNGGTGGETIPEPSLVFGLAIAAGLAVSLRKNDSSKVN